MKAPISLLIALAALGCRNQNNETAVPVDSADTADTADTADSGLPIPENVYTIEEDLYWDEDITLTTVWYIAEGATLTIAAGVNVSFQAGAGIVVDGAIVSEGTSEAPVNFKSASSLSTGNYGVSVGGSGDTSTLDHASFSSIGLRLEGEAIPSITGSSFADSTLEVYSRETGFSVTDCDFSENRRDNQSAIVARSVGQLDVSGATFTAVGNAIIYDGSPTSAVLNISSSTFENVTRAAHVGSVEEFQHTVSISDVSVSRATSQAFTFYGADATLSNVNISGTLSHGLYGDIDSTVIWTSGSVDDTIGVGINVQGSLHLTDVSVSNTDTHGIYAGENGSSATNVTVQNTEGNGIYSNGELTVSGGNFSNLRSSGIYAAYGDLTVDGATVSGALSHGIYAYRGALNATDVNVSEVEGTAIYAHSRDMTVSNAEITGARTYGLYVYRGNMNVSDITISDTESTAMYANDGSLVADGVSINDARGYGVYASYGSVTLTDTTITNTVNHSVYSYRGDITINPGTQGMLIEDTDGVGLYANTGNIYASGVTINRTRSHGVYAPYGSVELSDSSLTTVGGYAVYATYGDVTVSGLIATDFINSGVYAYQGDAAVSDSTFTHGERGIYVNQGDLEASDVTVHNTIYQGIYVNQGDMSLMDAEVADASDRGVYLSDGDAIVERLRVVDLDADGSSSESTGLDVRGYLLASDLLIDYSEGHGVYAESGDIAYGTFTNNDGRGVYYYGEELSSTLVYSDISGNLSYGVQGPSTGDNLVDVAYNNITDNFYYGTYFVRLVDSCYLADNYDGVGADLSEDLSLDGDLDTRTDQHYNVDSVSNAQSSPISGTGSSLSAN